jgi:motility quorum-sensing regulator / GCU-specific mRNA interferase toxin
VEKKKPHYSLREIKNLIKEGKVVITRNSQKTAGSIYGFDFDQIIEVVINLDSSDFYKSMTSHNDNKLWHDVYKKRTSSDYFYIKLQILQDDALVISFKGVE